MKDLVNFEHFNIINEANQKLDAYLDSVVGYSVNEAEAQPKTRLGAALGSPVKFIKIKNNAKKYQQTLVQKALNNLDYEKKKQAAGGEVDKDKLEVLKAANAAKNQALTDKGAAIADRMKDLATSPGLQKVKTLAMSKARVAAAETALKGADAEESKQLKIKIKELNAKAAEAEKAIKDYEKDEPQQETPQEEPTQQEEPKVKDDKNKDAIEKLNKEIEKAREAYKEVSKGDDVKAMTQAELKANELELKKAQLEDDKDAIKNATDAIAKIKSRPVEAGGEGGKTEPADGEGDKTEPADPKKEGLKKEITELESALNDLNAKEKKTKEDQNKIDILKVSIANKKKQLGESVQHNSSTYIGESVADRFRHLMTERLK